MEFLLSFWNFVCLSAPYLLLGLLVSGLMKLVIDTKGLANIAKGNSIWTTIKLALLGIPLPLCSCSVIPTAVTLRKAGVKNGPTSAFLIATPESGVDSISMTYGLMDLPMTILRPIIAFISAVTAGFFQTAYNDFDVPAESEEKSSCCAKTANPKGKISKVFSYGFGSLLDDIALWLTVGLLIGALIEFLVPVNFFQGDSGFIQRLVLLGIGIPIYICASATTPIAAAMVMKGMSPGMSLIILLAGPATNISNLAVLQKYIGKKGVVINVMVIAIVTFLASYLVDYLYSYFAWPVSFKLDSAHEHGNSLLEIGSGCILSLLLIRSLFNEYLRKLF